MEGGKCMREIKFRAWAKDGKGRHYMMSWLDLCTQPDLMALVDLENRDYVFMQFTGILDKNGKEIYEGDVVYFYLEGTPEDDYGNAEIIFSDGCFCVKHKVGEFPSNKEAVFNEYPFFVIDFTTTEVIGNIYENGELLK